MRHKTALLWVLGILLLLAMPWPVGWLLTHQDRFYERLVQDYECDPHQSCQADFDTDGSAEQLGIEPADPFDHGERWLVVRDASHEWLRVPYRSVDDTLRTHVAIRHDSQPTRLLIFDRGVGSVFVANRTLLVPVAPTDRDEQILAALAAHDDSGDFHQRLLLRLLGQLAGVLYYVVLIIVGASRLYMRYWQRA